MEYSLCCSYRLRNGNSLQSGTFLYIVIYGGVALKAGRKMKLEQKTKQFMEKQHMLSEHTGILIGLSGGADSVALLEVLCALRERWNLRIAAVHVHHGIRQEAQDDADFCQALCAAKQVEFYCEYADVPKLAQELGLTLEEAGRKVRYELFERYRQQLGLDVIAVAHHQNDQAETMLFQLFRGSGLRGVAGIPAKRGHIIRPLLGVTRAEIEEYLQEKQADYVTDATNLTDLYTRNKIRQRILPVAEEITNGAVANMNRAGAQLREVLDFMEQEADVFLEKYSSQIRHGEQTESSPAEQAEQTDTSRHNTDRELSLQAEPLRKAHPALQKMIIMGAIGRTFYSRRDITEKHVEAIRGLLEKEGEKVIRLPKGCNVIKRYDQLIFSCKKEPQMPENSNFTAMEIRPDETYFLPDGRILETRLIFDNNLENIPKNDCTKWFDYDKIMGSLILRNREKGDFLTINAGGFRKTLQDYLINEKVPRSERDSLLVLADGHHIVWVPGMRISAYYKITEQTEQILQVYIGGKQYGGES